MVDVPTIHTCGVLAQRRHPHGLLGIAMGHEHEVPGAGQQAIVRCDRQLAGQGFGIAVHRHQLVAVATVDQRRHLHPGQGMAPKQQAERRHEHHGPHPLVGLWHQLAAVGNQYTVGLAGVGVVRALQAVLAQAVQVRARA